MNVELVPNPKERLSGVIVDLLNDPPTKEGLKILTELMKLCDDEMKVAVHQTLLDAYMILARAKPKIVFEQVLAGEGDSEVSVPTSTRRRGRSDSHHKH